MTLKEKVVALLRWSQKYTKTDMVYIAHGSFWILIGRAAIAVISIATVFAFANWLPVETFGTYQFVLSIAALASIASLPGIKTSLVRSIAKGKEGSLLLAFRTKFKWGLLGSLALFAVSGWYFINSNTLLAGAFLITGIILPLQYSVDIAFVLWEGRKRFDLEAIYKTIAEIGIAVVIIATLFLTDNLWLIILAFFGGTTLSYGLIYLYNTKKTKNNEVDNEIVPFGKHLTAIDIIGNISAKIDTIILWKLLGPVQVAIYAFAGKPIEQLTRFLPLKRLAMPKFSEHGIKGEKRKKDIFRKLLLAFTITVPVAVALALIAPFVYSTLFPKYMESVIYFQALTFLIAMIPTSLMGVSLIAEMKIKHLYITKIIVPSVKIILFLALTPFLGIWGIIGATIITVILKAGLFIYFFWKI